MKETEKKYFELVTGCGRTDVFEIVDEFPKGFQVWNIGRHNFPYKGYIPLAEVTDFHVDFKTLKALKMPNEEICLKILKEAGRHSMDKRGFSLFVRYLCKDMTEEEKKEFKKYFKA